MGGGVRSVIGMGLMGEAHSRAYRLVSDRFVERGIEARLVACADADEGRAAAAADTALFGFERSTTDWRDIVGDSAIEAISITAPNDTHLAVMRAGLEGGEHGAVREAHGAHADNVEAARLARPGGPA